jgi:tRNA U34 2-thiouridine synthase MnmA/TrmU
MRKAVALLSGGLDSMLATRAILEQGIHVEGINFFTGFCVEGHTHALRKKDQQKEKRNNALWVAEQLNIKLHIIDIVEEYKDIVINPKYGYGAHLNPCLDCKIFMVRKAKEWMVEHNFDFIITGEVMGQRPKSQKKKFLPIVSQESGAEDRLLRPLCAKNLEPTLPEREGWVNREALFNFSGRSRKPQMDLAENYGISEYAQPAGGCCFLTNEHYTAKLKDLWENRGTRSYELDDIILLKVGRHLRPNQNFKLIIGREEGENNYLEGYCHQFTHLRSSSHLGPLALYDGENNAEDLHLAAQIVARFCHGQFAEKVSIQINSPVEESRMVEVKPLSATEIKEEWYI